MPGSPTAPDRRGARAGAPRRVAFRLINGVGVRDFPISRLNGWPVRSPADASPLPSRADTHGSGPMWVATPSSQWTCTTYSLPVSRRTNYPGGSDLRSYHDFCPGSDVVDVFQTVTVLRSAAKVPGPWLMRSVETTVRTAASPSADQVER